MPRNIPVGNGSLLICFDHEYCIRDRYFPHVGQENHLTGNPCRFGVWVEGQFSWIGSDWQPQLYYEEDTLVTQVTLHHQDLGLLLECRDAVDFHENLFLREVTVKNLIPKRREIRLFFGQGFNISAFRESAHFKLTTPYKGRALSLPLYWGTNNEQIHDDRPRKRAFAEARLRPDW